MNGHKLHNTSLGDEPTGLTLALAAHHLRGFDSLYEEVADTINETNDLCKTQERVSGLS